MNNISRIENNDIEEVVLENTSCVSKIAYEIEGLIQNGKSREEIDDLIDEKKDDNKFPKNLEFIDYSYDESSVICVAFKDTSSHNDEVIIGVAGTKVDEFIKHPIESTKDILADIDIAASGSSVVGDELYYDGAIEFVERMKEDHNVTQITGHSLGGNISAIVGVYTDIPNIITYNGAPIYITKTSIFLGGLKTTTPLGYKDIFTNIEGVLENHIYQYGIYNKFQSYDGKIIRFVSDKDILNKASDFMDGAYFGEEILIGNGKGHGLDFFLEPGEQKIIDEYLYERIFKKRVFFTFNEGEKEEVTLGFGKGTIDIKDLMQENGKSNYGTGEEFKITSDSFNFLADNLRTMIEHELRDIKMCINECIEINNAIKDNNTIRKEELNDEIINELDNAKLSSLIRGINNSHGELTKTYNLQVLESFENMDTYSTTRKFDWLGTSGTRKWYIDGTELDTSKMNKHIRSLKTSGSILKESINKEVFIGRYYGRFATCIEIYTKNSISSVGKLFEDVTNNFISRTEDIFQGIGLRSSMKDGITDALDEVLAIQLINIEKIEEFILNISKIADEIATNYEELDKLVSRFIEAKESSPFFDVQNIPESYEEYLEENNIFDDVKDVIEAFDIQVEEAAKKLAIEIVQDYEPVVEETRALFKVIMDDFVEFNDSVRYLNEKINQKITSKTKWYAQSLYELIVKDEEKQHGTLNTNLPTGIGSKIIHSANNISPILDELLAADTKINEFNNNIKEIEVQFKDIIYRAVYNYMDLEDIITIQKIITGNIYIIKKEIENVTNIIESSNKGNTLNRYCIQLRSIIKLLDYFYKLSEDCYGEM